MTSRFATDLFSSARKDRGTWKGSGPKPLPRLPLIYSTLQYKRKRFNKKDFRVFPYAKVREPLS